MRAHGDQKATSGWRRWARCVRRLVGRALQWTAHPWVRHGITAILSLFAVATIGGLLYANWDTLRGFEWRIRPAPLLLSFPVYGLALALAALAWARIMRALGSSVALSEHVRVYYVTNLARRLPGVLWYVVGRVALYEVMRFGDTLKEMVLQGASTAELKLAAIKAGMSTLRMSGIKKVLEGVTTPEEILRVTMSD